MYRQRHIATTKPITISQETHTQKNKVTQSRCSWQRRVMEKHGSKFAKQSRMLSQAKKIDVITKSVIFHS